MNRFIARPLCSIFLLMTAFMLIVSFADNASAQLGGLDNVISSAKTGASNINNAVTGAASTLNGPSTQIAGSLGTLSNGVQGLTGDIGGIFGTLSGGGTLTNIPNQFGQNALNNLLGSTGLGNLLGSVGGLINSLSGLASLFSSTDPGEIIGKVLCVVADWIAGPVGKGLASLSVVVLGLGFLTGKISPPTAALVIGGIATIFGAPILLNDALLGIDGGNGGCFTSNASTGLSISLFNSAIADVLCEVVGWMMGSIGRAVSTLAILVLGIGAMFGKISWPMALTTCIGVGIIYSAPDIISTFSSAAGQTLVFSC